MSVPDDILAFNRTVIDEFRANDGEISSGMLKGSRLVLLTTTGAKSRKTRTTPLGYFTDGPDRIVIWASNMAAPSHPAWYHNLSANSRVSVEVATDSGIERFDATATTARGEERARLLEALAAWNAGVADHQKQTSREIPLVVLQRAGG